jgi:hypothetical protein
MALVSAFAAVCEKILIERDNVISLIRMADMFTVMPNLPRLPDGSLPALPMQLYIALRFTHDDAGEHEVSFKLIRPNGNEKVHAITKTAAALSVIPESDRGMNVGIPLGVIPEQMGRHEIVVLVDENPVARTAFFIVLLSEIAAGATT